MTIYEEIAFKLESYGLSAPETQKILRRGIVKADIENIFKSLDLGSFDWLEDSTNFNEVETELVLKIVKVHVRDWIIRDCCLHWTKPLFDTEEIKLFKSKIKKLREHN